VSRKNGPWNLHFKVTVRVVFPEVVPELAVIITVPAATAVANPLVLMVATEGLDEPQVTDSVILWLDPSENVPVAVNCWVAPTSRLGLDGVTPMEDRVAEITVNVTLAEKVSEVAVIVEVPAATAVAKPLPLTVATAGLDELQVTDMVISRVDPSENVPVAINC